MRRLVLILVVLWLPLQGMAAVVMPFCKQAQPAAAGHAPPHEHQAGKQHQPPVLHGCDDCGVCHLACAPGVPSEVALTLELTATGPARFKAQAPPRFVPDQPRRPPLARA
jgi:hypothetical protein